MAIAEATPETSTKTAIGKVIALEATGEESPRVFARDPGTEQSRELSIGAPVYADEIIITGPQAVIAIEFLDGTRFDLGRGSEMALGADVFDPSRVSTDSGAGAAPITDIDAIQQALLAGVDPTTELEAAAAGPGDASNEGSSFVILDRSTQRTTPESGYDTLGIGVEFNENVQELLLEPLEAPGALGLVVGDLSAVNEDDLAAGSDLSKESLTQTGTIQITAGDGIGSLVVGGITVISNNVFTPVSAPIGNMQGATTLSFVDFNPDTGSLNYEFTLTDRMQHAPLSGANSLGQEVGIILKDMDGDSVAAALSLTVIDDIPTAGADAGEINEDAVVPAEFNRSENDEGGADQPAAIVIADPAGQFGTLSLVNGEWAYAFTPDGQAAAQLLGDVESGPESLVENFSYTITDADGDTSTAAVKVTITGVDDPVVITGLDGESSEVTVDEANLNPTTSASNTFGISMPDGFGELEVQGTSMSLAELQNSASTPVDIVTPLGNTVTINGYSGDATGGTVSYTYTLLNAETHPADGSEALTVILTDDDGDQDTAVIDVTILDDTPVAGPDAGSIGEDAETPVAFNRSDDDDFGADGPATSGSIVIADPAGQFGTLSLVNGEWAYAFTPDGQAAAQLLGDVESGPESLVENFSYTITDADGDTSTAAVKVTITGVDDPVVITGLDGESSEVTVDEANLNPTTSASNTFGISMPDGFGELEVQGTSMSLAELQNSASTPVDIVTPLGNTVTINGYSGDATGGTVSYTYTLLNAETHPADGSEALTVILTDDDGDQDTAVIDVTILDDTPVAGPDAGSIGEDAETPVAFNRSDDDDFGADGPATSGSIVIANPAGQFGTLSLVNGEWAYAFTPDGQAAAQLLGDVESGPESLVENFSYTITDADGDTSTAAVKVTITGVDDPVVITGLDGESSEVTVDEANLNPTTSASNTFGISMPDGFGELEVQGTSMSLAELQNSASTPVDIVTPLGNTVTINGYSGDATGGTVSYTYTLLNAETHPADGSEALTVILTDDDGDQDTAVIDVTILDDTPVAGPDAGSIGEDAETPVAFNRSDDDDFGADGPATSGSIVIANPAGQFGTLSLVNGEWAYAFTPDGQAAAQLLGDVESGPESLVENFSYTITDADGDTSTAAVKVTITGVDDPVVITGLDGESSEVTVDEANLNPTTSASNTFGISMPDGFGELEVQGTSMSLAELQNSASTPVDIVTPLGNTVTINGYSGDATGGTVSYTYTLLNAETHPADGSEALTVILTDDDGDQDTAVIDVTILDDTPVAGPDAGSIGEDADAPVAFNRSDDDDFGADGPATSGSIVIADPAGQFGTLSLVNGEWAYAFTPDGQAAAQLLGDVESGPESLVENFSYTITDADGDTSTAAVKVTITGVDDPVVITGLDGESSEVTVDEANLNPTTSASNTFGISMPDGFGELEVQGTSMSLAELQNSASTPVDIVTPLGNTVTINGYSGDATGGTVSYTYTLLNAETHPADGSEALTVILTDDDGDQDTAVIDVTILDDTPVAGPDAGSIGEDAETPVAFNRSDDDDFGADGPATSGSIVIADPAGQFGTLSLVNGEWAYAFTPDGQAAAQLLGDVESGPESLVENFSYTITDADGDTSTAAVKVTITGIDDPVVITGLDGESSEVTVDEANLNPTTSASNTFGISMPDGFGELEVQGTSMSLAELQNSASTPVDIVTPLGNTVTINGYSGDATGGTVSYTYTLLNAETHPADGSEALTVILTDDDGDQDTAVIDVTILDDTPVAGPDAGSIGEDAETPVAFNRSDDDDFGADGPATSGSIVIADPAGQFGTLSLVNGEWAYAFTPDGQAAAQLLGEVEDTPQTLTENFSYTIIDADGDTSSASVVVTINGQDDPVEINLINASVDENDLPQASATETFSISAPDGVDNVTIDGITVIQGSDLVDTPVQGSFGTLKITYYDAANGLVEYSYTLSSSVQHDQFPNQEVVDDFDVVLTDGDGDQASGVLEVHVVDDVPENIHPTAAILNNEAVAITEGALDVDFNVDDNTGADQAGVVTFNPSQQGDSGLTSEGQAIYNHLSADGQTLTGSTSSTQGAVTADNTVYTVTINQDGDILQASDTYNLSLFSQIDHGVTASFENLSGTGPAGNPAFKIVESTNLPGVEILFTPAGTASSVNSDSDDVGVDSQFIDDDNPSGLGDGLRIDFGAFTFIPKAGSTPANYTLDESSRVNGFGFGIDQISSGNTASILLRAIDDTDLDETVTNGVVDPITNVQVFDQVGTLIGSWDEGSATIPQGSGISFADMGDGTVRVQGAIEDNCIVTSTQDGYNRIEVFNDSQVEDDGKFSLNQLEVLVFDTGEPVDTSFELLLTDADGDHASGTLNVLLEPANVSIDNEIEGTEGNDRLFGGAGEDVIDGKAGDDTIGGGTGDDTLTGGSGSDTFEYNAAFNEGKDKITDFRASTTADDPEEDVLLFRDALDANNDGIMGLEELQQVIRDVTHDSQGNTTLHLYDGGSIELLGFGQYTTLDSLLDTGIEIQLIPPDS